MLSPPVNIRHKWIVCAPFFSDGHSPQIAWPWAAGWVAGDSQATCRRLTRHSQAAGLHKRDFTHLTSGALIVLQCSYHSLALGHDVLVQSACAWVALAGEKTGRALRT